MKLTGTKPNLLVLMALAVCIWASRANAVGMATELTYFDGTEDLSGYSATFSTGEPPVWEWCAQTVNTIETPWGIYELPSPLCVLIIRNQYLFGIEGMLESPTGLHGYGANYYQAYSAGINYYESGPAPGTWTGWANHLIHEDSEQCSVSYQFEGDFQLVPYVSCYYMYSYTYYMGASSAQTVVTPPPCTASTHPTEFDTNAVSAARTWPGHEPYERGVTIRCVAPGNFLYEYWTSSFGDIYPVNGVTIFQDPCRVAHRGLRKSGSTGAVHSHPYFYTPGQYIAGAGCLGDTTLPTMQEIQNLNQNINTDFSVNDINGFKCLNSPSYVVSSLYVGIGKFQGHDPTCPTTNKTWVIPP